jgi:hypothetical protein
MVRVTTRRRETVWQARRFSAGGWGVVTRQLNTYLDRVLTATETDPNATATFITVAA